MIKELIDYRKYADQEAFHYWKKESWNTAERHFKKICRWVITLGVYPGPVVLNKMIHNHNSRNLNGRETKWRREIMKENNVPLQRPDATDMHEIMYGDYEDTYEY